MLSKTKIHWKQRKGGSREEEKRKKRRRQRKKEDCSGNADRHPGNWAKDRVSDDLADRLFLCSAFDFFALYSTRPTLMNY